MSVVLDSSATLAWIYSDEITDAIRDIFRTVSHEGAWVPALWRLEVANILEMGVRRGRHDRGFRDATLPSFLSALTRKPTFTHGTPRCASPSATF